jgi:hypothetical protein
MGVILTSEGVIYNLTVRFFISKSVNSHLDGCDFLPQKGVIDFLKA